MTHIVEVATAAYGVLGFFVFAIAIIDNRSFPVCPKCEDNMKTRRTRFFFEEAVCTKHGKFVS